LQPGLRSLYLVAELLRRGGRSEFRVNGHLDPHDAPKHILVEGYQRYIKQATSGQIPEPL
jgi:hypothetical protein